MKYVIVVIFMIVGVALTQPYFTRKYYDNAGCKGIHIGFFHYTTSIGPGCNTTGCFKLAGVDLYATDDCTGSDNYNDASFSTVNFYIDNSCDSPYSIFGAPPGLCLPTYSTGGETATFAKLSSCDSGEFTVTTYSDTKCSADPHVVTAHQTCENFGTDLYYIMVGRCVAAAPSTAPNASPTGSPTTSPVTSTPGNKSNDASSIVSVISILGGVLALIV